MFVGGVLNLTCRTGVSWFVMVIGLRGSLPTCMKNRWSFTQTFALKQVSAHSLSSGEHTVLLTPAALVVVTSLIGLISLTSNLWSGRRATSPPKQVTFDPLVGLISLEFIVPLTVKSPVTVRSGNAPMPWPRTVSAWMDREACSCFLFFAAICFAWEGFSFWVLATSCATGLCWVATFCFLGDLGLIVFFIFF